MPSETPGATTDGKTVSVGDRDGEDGGSRRPAERWRLAARLKSPPARFTLTTTNLHP